MNIRKIGQTLLAFLICFFAQDALYANVRATPPGVDAPRVRQLPPYPPPDPAIYTH